MANPMVQQGSYHTVGLKPDGTVVQVGDNNYGQCNVSDWTDIIQIQQCGYHTVGLKPDGTVVQVGDNQFGQCSVSGWDLYFTPTINFLIKNIGVWKEVTNIYIKDSGTWKEVINVYMKINGSWKLIK